MLLALYGTPSPPSPSAGDSSTEFEPRPHLPPRWLTAYTLMLEQYGCLPSRVEDVGNTVTGAGHAAPSIAVKDAADSGMPGAAAGQSVARLPDGLLHRGLLLQQQLLERDRPAQAVRRRTLYPATLEVCGCQYWKWRVVWLYWAVQVVADGQVTGSVLVGLWLRTRSVGGGCLGVAVWYLWNMASL